ncbi:TrkH family potassium uptake protein [Pararhodospirillum photometricum]|uniref:Trk system potassium uptake protein n=1 Tax=Pararhodospirillum photometricum DSM 122 TaxID=1150469 RepID=H6SJ06_PARPM|nr:TrkH family potassium uptake protein [Pararhodospirillum photometricum]CCG07971.1 Cation transporter [Pararhodospirillum photometricum DSM 122]
MALNDPRELGAPGLCLGTVDLSPVFFVLGLFTTGLGLAMLAPALLDALVRDQDWLGFLWASGITVFVGLGLAFANARPHLHLSMRQGFILTASAWFTLGVFGSLPFMFSSEHLSFSDAYFETISGLTTTGSTVISGLDTQPPGILFWRALLQWIGGIGIIGMAIALLPALRVGGMQLFRMESSDTTERGLTRIGALGVSISAVYLALTALIMVAYLAVGQSPFDAVCLAFATVSTGGFANSDASLAALPPLGLWLSTMGMMLGSLPFPLYVRAARGDFGLLWRDAQVRGFVVFLATCWLGVALWRVMQGEVGFFHALTTSAFNLTSVVTTTGFASEDYTLWGPFPVLMFFMLTFVGGCTGSTAGGIKTFRLQVSLKILRAHIRRRYLPHAVILPTYAGRPIDDDIAISVLLFFFAMGSTTSLIAVILTALGLDWVTALSGAATAVCNVGPGLGPIIGPVGNFAPLPDSAKWVLSVAMVLGRLEFFTVYVLLSRRFWSE